MKDPLKKIRFHWTEKLLPFESVSEKIDENSLPLAAIKVSMEEVFEKLEQNGFQ